MLSSFFGKKKKKDSLGEAAVNPYPPLPNITYPQPEENNQRWAFLAQLAHGSPTVKIEGFSNVKELYEKIASALNMPCEEILFCTLNTHKCDMEKLLGGVIGLDEVIFAHAKGRKKVVQLKKSELKIGLTITDNGAGYAFIKTIWTNSIAEKCREIFVGDHIEAIDDILLVGRRHFEVANRLKGILPGSTFSMTLVEPRKAFDMISQRKAPQMAVNDNYVGSGKGTLRLRSLGPATVEEVPSEQEDKAVDMIDDCLESYMEIKDNELATTMYETAMECSSPLHFKQLVESTIGEFGFPENFFFQVWGIISDAKKGRI